MANVATGSASAYLLLGGDLKSGFVDCNYRQVSFETRTDVRAVLCHRNAEVLISLYEQGRRVTVCGVNVLWSCTKSLRVQEAFQKTIAVESSERRASSGGWRLMTAEDFCLLKAWQSLMKKDRLAAIGFAKQHPAWRYLSFLKPFDPLSASVILSSLLDPRSWTLFPDKLDAADAFINVCCGRPPVPSSSALVGGQTCDELAEACRRVWQYGDGSCTVSVNEPGAFLLRKAEEATSALKDNAHPMRVATHRFAHYLRACWLDSLNLLPARRRWFMPERFFVSEPATATAFRKEVWGA